MTPRARLPVQLKPCVYILQAQPLIGYVAPLCDGLTCLTPAVSQAKNS